MVPVHDHVLSHDNGLDEVWLGLLGLERRDRDDVEGGEGNRTGASRGATSRLEAGHCTSLYP